jgi:hypothetical protein
VEAILAREPGPVTIVAGGWDSPSVRYYTRRATDRVLLRTTPPSVDASPFYLLESSAWRDQTGIMDPLKATASVTFDGGGVTVYRVAR